MDDFGSWVTRQLVERGWSRSEAARRGGISSTAVNRIVDGGTPGLEFCRGLARAFEMPMETVMRYAGILPAVEDDPGEAELVAYYRALPENDRRKALGIIRELCSTGQKNKER